MTFHIQVRRLVISGEFEVKKYLARKKVLNFFGGLIGRKKKIVWLSEDCFTSISISFTTYQRYCMDVFRRKYPSQIEGVKSQRTTGGGGGIVVVNLNGEILDAAEVEEEVALDAEAAGGHEAQVQPPVANVLKYTDYAPSSVIHFCMGRGILI